MRSCIFVEQSYQHFLVAHSAWLEATPCLSVSSEDTPTKWHGCRGVRNDRSMTTTEWAVMLLNVARHDELPFALHTLSL